jgi:hypothetical protein
LNSTSGGEGQAVVNNDSSSDLLEQMACGEVSISAIGHGGRSVWCHWWTHVVSLVRLWDSECGSTRNKERKNIDNFTA